MALLDAAVKEEVVDLAVAEKPFGAVVADEELNAETFEQTFSFRCGKVFNLKPSKLPNPTSPYLVVAFALPKRIQRGLAVDRRAAVAVRITSVALSRVCSALDRVRRLVYDKKIVLKRNYHIF